ncbi:MAG: serine/threonine protein kinase [Ruminobacter sp.]|uniref:protein kinase domain-containing protein n=1 Tax=Ruminobacter sp. TaxID=2774296 RepID=UPI00257B3F6E|nr:protein kinase [Ruminobacter sp.]MBQ3775715.1 serine/threonine protein kinase [Ruminobacter sp.]
MSSETLLNSANNKTLINTGSGSEVDNLTGTVVLEKYTLLNKINDPSGEAALYMAVGNTSQNSSVQNTPVVVKIYRRKEAVKQEVLNKLAKLKSPGIVEIIDHGFYNGFACIVMPYYMNGSLAGKTLTYGVIKDIVIPEVTAGLKYLHENGIIHKDIKPANLMISNDGKHVHIIDFGISSAKDDGVSVLITKTGMSPEYCAPETFNNVWVEESDFYSFGITLFELFKGHTPFNYSSDRDALAASASIQKIRFSLDFPEELVNLIKGLTYKDLSNRNDPNNPNRRWNWNEIEKWLKGENIPVPGELNSNNKTSDSTGNTSESSGYIFSNPYDFRNNQGKVVKLNNLAEFTDAFGLNWNDGKKHVGRGFASKFFIQQNMQNSASIIMDCEDAGITDMAYAKMLIELSASAGNYRLYWNSVRVDDNMKILSDLLTDALYSQNNNLNEEFDTIRQLLCCWYEKTGKDKELGVINNLQKIAEVYSDDLSTKIIALCSFIDPNLVIKIGNDIFHTAEELKTKTQKQKLSNEEQYFEWLLNNQNDITRYQACIIPAVKQIIDNLLQDLHSELNRRREEQARKEREEKARKEREEKARKEPEIRIFGKPLSSVRKGDIIRYGKYYQDTDRQKSPIEWLVLDVKEKEVLLISRYALDCKQYYHGYTSTSITWENCDLRKWLNGDFIKSAFSEEEAERILVSDIKNDDIPQHHKGGNNTKDRVFCLSISEAEQYFGNDESRKCKPTAYARQQGASVYNDCCYWWLRSPYTPGSKFGYFWLMKERNAACVRTVGSLYPIGRSVNYDRVAVRPALRIICNQ